MNKLRVALGVIVAFTLCMMVSCTKEKEKDTTGQIKGIVTNATTNEPVQGVNISLNPIGLTASTDSDGRYEFTNLEAGQYTLQGEKSGFESCTKNVTVVAGNTTSGDMQLQSAGNVIIGDGLFCYFDFENEELVDCTENYTGINSGTVASTDTPSGEGKSRQFDGNSFIMIQDNIIPADNHFSINVWFKTGRNDQYLIGSDEHYYSDPTYYFKFTNNSTFKYVTSFYNGTSETASISSYIDNQWHMLTITVDDETIMFYIDGSLFETKTMNNLSWSSNINSTFIGAVSISNTNKFNGKLDNLRSYNRALTPTEVRTLYNAKQ